MSGNGPGARPWWLRVDGAPAFVGDIHWKPIALLTRREVWLARVGWCLILAVGVVSAVTVEWELIFGPLSFLAVTGFTNGTARVRQVIGWPPPQ